MNPETFFEKFGLFADAPDAVATMRELVLQLAVQGKLVEQKIGDGDAKQLLVAIARERNALAANFRTPSKPESAISNEPAFPIPPNWTWAQLGNIALQIQYGYTASADPSATVIRMLRITDIQNNRVDWPSVPGCQIEADEAEKYLLSPNDIVIARTGGTIGKSFIVLDAPVRSVFASYLIRVTPPQSMAAKYLKIFLESPLYWSQLRKMSAGTGQPNVNGQALGRLEIPLPPLAEQKRIVAKVDELMALCDRLEQQLQQREEEASKLARASLARFSDAPTLANLDFLFHKSYDITPADLRKSIFTLAVQGKLVPQDPDDEPAEELLERIKAAREALAIERGARQSNEVEYSRQEEGDVAPPGWIAVHVNDVALVQGGKRLPNGAVFSELPTQHVYIRVTDMKNGTISEDGLRYISPEVQREISRYIINKEDLYITIAGTIGDVGCVPESLDGQNLTENAAKIVFRGFDKRFFQLALSSQFVQSQFLEKTKQMAQPKLALKRIAGAKFFIPPLAEQRRIVSKLDELMVLVDTLEIQLATAHSTSSALLHAVVHEITNGGANHAVEV